MNFLDNDGYLLWRNNEWANTPLKTNSAGAHWVSKAPGLKHALLPYSGESKFELVENASYISFLLWLYKRPLTMSNDKIRTPWVAILHSAIRKRNNFKCRAIGRPSCPLFDLITGVDGKTNGFSQSKQIHSVIAVMVSINHLTQPILMALAVWF